VTRPRHAFGQQRGRLVATMLRALAAELSEPGRYARGKSYARDGAVIDIDLRPGVAAGLVLGSRRDPYEVHLVADPAPADELTRASVAHPATMSLLIPGRDELSVACTCPDAAGSLCKHAVAVLLVLADETSIEPHLLTRWRTAPDSSGDVVRPALTRLAPRGRAVAPRREPPAAAARVDVLAGMLGATSELPELPTIAPAEHAPPPAVALADASIRLVDELTRSARAAITGQRR
jgi:hypothetical protein